jgi:hypothetical protein
MGVLNSRLDRMWVGTLFGVVVPFLTFVIYHSVKYGHMGIHNFVYYIRNEGTFSPRISLCVIMNLGLFFIFYKLKMDRSARGIILATFLYAGLVVYLKVLS